MCNTCIHDLAAIDIPCQHSKYCTDNKSHNEWYVLDGIDLHSSCIWIQTEVVREVEAKETAQVEHLWMAKKFKQDYACNFLHKMLFRF